MPFGIDEGNFDIEILNKVSNKSHDLIAPWKNHSQKKYSEYANMGSQYKTKTHLIRKTIRIILPWQLIMY